MMTPLSLLLLAVQQVHYLRNDLRQELVAQAAAQEQRHAPTGLARYTDAVSRALRLIFSSSSLDELAKVGQLTAMWMDA